MIHAPSGLRPATPPLRSARWDSVVDFEAFSVSVRQWRSDAGSHLHASGNVLVLSRGGIALGGMRGTSLHAHIAERVTQGVPLDALLSGAHGLFVVLTVDRRARRASLCTSKSGILPLYRCSDSAGTTVSTSLLGLAASRPALLNRRGVEEFTHFGNGVEGRTIFAGLERLQSPVVVTADKAGLTVKPLPSLLSLLSGSEVSTIEACGEAILDSTSGFAADSRGVVAALTAGTDSRTVIGALVKLGSFPTTFTRDHVPTDVRQAAKVAALGLVHEVEHQPEGYVNVEELDAAIDLTDGAADPLSQSLLLPALRSRAERFGTFFGGAGGPLFKDHFWLFEANRVDRRREPNWVRLARHAVVGHPLIPSYFGGDESPFVSLADAFLRKSQDLPGATNNRKLDYVYYAYKQPAFTGPSIAAVSRLMDSVEPLLDLTAVAKSIELPTRQRKNNILQFTLVENWIPATRWIAAGDGLPFIPPIGVATPLRALRVRRVAAAATRKARVTMLRSTSSGALQPTQVDAETLSIIRGAASGPAAGLVEPLALESSLSTKFTGPDFRYLCALASVNLFLRAAEATPVAVSPAEPLDSAVRQWLEVRV